MGKTLASDSTEGKYREAIREFLEGDNDCDPESVAASPLVAQLAKHHGKTLEQVALDINRGWIQSYRSPLSDDMDF